MLLGGLQAVLALVSLGHTALGSVGGGRFPSSRSPGGGLLEHSVDLLKRKSLGLGDEEEGVDEGASAETSPDEEDVGAEVALALTGADHVRGDDGNDLEDKLGNLVDARASTYSVPEPV